MKFILIEACPVQSFMESIFFLMNEQVNFLRINPIFPEVSVKNKTFSAVILLYNVSGFLCSILILLVHHLSETQEG